jgi:putative tributyrin esterase
MPRFRTVEVSDPQYEHDYLRHVTVKSPVLKGRGDITLFVPPGIEALKNVPIAMLLHGVYGSHWAWALKGGAHKTALRMIESRAIRPIILAMPSDGLWGDGSGYVPHVNADYEKWIMNDVVDCVREVVPQTAGGKLFLSGLSMGGFGALRLGARYASRVAGISAHSSCTNMNDLAKFLEEPLSAFGSLSDVEKSATHALLEAKSALPPLRFDCGESDELIEVNRALHKTLLNAGVSHEYQEFPGAHSWDYWREHLVDTLKFFERCMQES